ncbi:hypothetical protein [Sphingomonas glaciei]|uniref:Uncharacterized protein n=1 Tax=Sphingomonas glaciei TaxID=2938948 RepID=A0ABY5MV80_9SPHN|nr:hypothetical protein [Sphingomonas glaciei]UUR07650.1 hypothetical protein M1K48_12045 [Sphingomonas glaciei]
MYRFLAAALLLASAVPAAAAAPGTAENFLNRADRLVAKGPLALVDADYKNLKREGTAAGDSIRLEREAAEKAGKPILYCSPPSRAPNWATWNSSPRCGRSRRPSASG